MLAGFGGFGDHVMRARLLVGGVPREVFYRVFEIEISGEMHHQEYDFAAVLSAFEMVPSGVGTFERIDRVTFHRLEAFSVHHNAGPSSVEMRVDFLDGYRFVKAINARAATGGGQ